MIRMSINTEVRPADAEGIARAAELLRQGELVALPTETVYGIAADARNGEAVSKILWRRDVRRTIPSSSTSQALRCCTASSAKCRNAPSC